MELPDPRKRTFSDTDLGHQGDLQGDGHDSQQHSFHDDSPSPRSGNHHGSFGNRSRPIRSCTHCRQQKVKCDASDTYPGPCTRCAKAGRDCRVDPYFKPKKGGQVQSLRDDVSALRRQVEYLQQRESALAMAVAKTDPNSALLRRPTTDSSSENPIQESSLSHQQLHHQPHQPQGSSSFSASTPTINPVISAQQHQQSQPGAPGANISASFTSFGSGHGGSGSGSAPGPGQMTHSRSLPGNSLNHASSPESVDSKSSHNSVHKQSSFHRNTIASTPSDSSTPKHPSSLPISTLLDNDSSDSAAKSVDSSHQNNSAPHHRNTTPVPAPSEYVLGEIQLSSERAEELHTRFVTKFLPYLPIMHSNSAAELYQQSELLFWTVCLTACLSEPEPSLYNSLSVVIKHLAIETCWIRTPRSTHIVQALIILGNWPLPNEKVLDDCSYRFVGLAKNLAMQLGLHRGEFMYEFSRTQVALPDAEKWRTRTWLAVFFSEQTYSSILGLPSTMSVDFLIDRAHSDPSLPPQFRALVQLATFYYKLTNIIGSSVRTVDGLVSARDRVSTLAILEQELEHLVAVIDTTPASVEIYYLYVKLMICGFAFLPGSDQVEQSKYIVQAFHAGTRIITIISTLVEKRQIIEFPIYMRTAVTYSAFMLFRLHLSPLLPKAHVESARQSVVTVHRLFRNMLTAWKDVQNDISRTAKVLENLNYVILTHPYLFTQSKGIITRMRSHLTASLFYELIWAVHEARRRSAKDNNGGKPMPKQLIGPNPPAFAHLETVPPLPFYNQITRDDFITNTTTTPNGTTITTLVPAHPNASLQGHHTNGYEHNNSTDNDNNNNGGSKNDGSVINNGPKSPHAAPAPIPGAALKMEWDSNNNNSSSSNANNNNNNNSNVQSNAHAGNGASTNNDLTALLDSTGASNDPLHLDTLLQGMDWMNSANGDDFLGWMDVNMKF